MLRPARSSLFIALLALAAALPSGCAGLTGGTDLGEPDYSSDADSNLKRGDEALDSKNFLEAERYYQYVKSKYPFLEAAKEAELRLADTDFERERYIEARDRYQTFVKLHPTHPKVDYAAFRAAQTHYKDIPSDFFLLPPSREKDQVEVRAALSAMGEFVRLHPGSVYLAEAKVIIDDSRKRLAAHELYVADFYARRQRWPAVVGRLTRLVEEYPGLGLDEEAYFGLYRAYLKLNDTARAQETLRSVIAKLPGTKAAEKAQQLLGAGG
ncbi:MAG: outer membrane protein assembly factor BamD [Myxococcaceae bacterium]